MSGPKSVLDGLRERSVWQVLAVYLGVSWVALQVVDLLKQNMGLPDWVFPFALLLLLIGFLIINPTTRRFISGGGGTGCRIFKVEGRYGIRGQSEPAQSCVACLST